MSEAQNAEYQAALERQRQQAEAAEAAAAAIRNASEAAAALNAQIAAHLGR
ncbi:MULTISPECIES: hypothetical protein [Streptomyces]|uniref:Uncharacterized protein n=1 Tax=Streptomyces yangpuensis TaxID=1648182 RepID=A0ABY5QAB5_9ACTN|nr:MULTISPECIES: hypothetical protein [Streptomyces]UUY52778.1 hypothetical protein NRK68_36600 [Streptomyces yangpuensis]